MEQWRKVPNYSRYEVSNTGHIRSTNYQNRGYTQVLKPALTGGYLKTMIKNDSGYFKTIAIHRIIALVFLGDKPSKLHEVNHIDGNKQNNSVKNLEYVTHKENVIHAFKNNLVGTREGSKNSFSKLTEKQVIEIRNHAAANGRFYGNKELAEKYGVSCDLIQRIVNRRMWKHI
jgi:hypothetical protein